jgi:hypothetical protein
MADNRANNFIVVAPKEGEPFTYGFTFDNSYDNTQLRSFASDVTMIQVALRDKERLFAQFRNLPMPMVQDVGPVVYYGDFAKFVCRHLNLRYQPPADKE